MKTGFQLIKAKMLTSTYNTTFQVQLNLVVWSRAGNPPCTFCEKSPVTTIQTLIVVLTLRPPDPNKLRDNYEKLFFECEH